MVADLLGFLKYMSEPSAMQRRHLRRDRPGSAAGPAIVVKPADKKPRQRHPAEAST